METISILREIVYDIDVSDIPLKYIAAVSYIDAYDQEQVVHGLEEIEKLVKRSYPFDGIESVNLLLDFRQIAIDVATETNRIHKNIQKIFYDDIGDD